MDKNLIVFENELDKSIEKKFKKYILEVDDAIEAYGFKNASYIDYAEDNISKLQDSTKELFKEHGSSLLFTNLLETSLDNVISDIVNYTFENESLKYDISIPTNLNEKSLNLHENLKFLNSRLLNSFKNL